MKTLREPTEPQAKDNSAKDQLKTAQKAMRKDKARFREWAQTNSKAKKQKQL
jgi:hypothetical protein